MTTEQSTSETKPAVEADKPVTISAPTQSVTIDPQNPLPEPSFFWRRVISAAVCAVLLGIAWHNAIQLHDLGVSADLLQFAKWCIGLNGFVLLCYFVGPSAAEIIGMIQSARIIKSSLAMASNADDNASKSSESALNRAETRAERRYQRSTAADSRFPDAPLSEAPSAYGIDDDEDFAPRGR